MIKWEIKKDVLNFKTIKNSYFDIITTKDSVILTNSESMDEWFNRLLKERENIYD